jgi:hypothetical protein
VFRVALLFVSLLWMRLGVVPVSAQSLIVGIPSPETTPKDHMMVTHESQLSPWSQKEPWNTFNFVTYGLTEHTELALSASNASLKNMDNFSLALGFKTTKPLFLDKFPKNELKVTLGQMVPVSLTGKGVGSWTFSTLSTRIPKTRTRLTGGVSVGTRQIFGRDKVAFIGGVEQPLTKKISLVADWYSGTHDLAAFIPAIQYNINKHDVLIVGYKMPNNDRSGKHAIIIEFNKMFD